MIGDQRTTAISVRNPIIAPLIRNVMRSGTRSSCHLSLLLPVFHALVITVLALGERAVVNAPLTAASQPPYSAQGSATGTPHQAHALQLSELQRPAHAVQLQRPLTHGGIPAGSTERMAHHRGRTIMSEDQALQV